MTDIAKYINISEYVSEDNKNKEVQAEEMALFLSAPKESSVTIFKNPIKTWEQQVDLGFAAWASQELKVPYKEAILVKVSEKFE
jgi:dsDNA-binding SOS-regulon protein